ncbi:hypothetical protein VCSRO48_1044 [Vibrio cholerae]|nr:hypothetical protein VCSRO48_1044 [Vibrio cholerae]
MAHDWDEYAANWEKDKTQRPMLLRKAYLNI